MKCSKCKRKGSFITCNYCKHVFCASCVAVESHNCENTSECVKKQIEILKSNLTLGHKIKYNNYN